MWTSVLNQPHVTSTRYAPILQDHTHVPVRMDLLGLDSTVQVVEKLLYLTMHSTHFIYGYNYGVGHMIKDHSDSEGENPLPPHILLSPVSSKGSFICTIPQDSTYHDLCYITGWNEK